MKASKGVHRLAVLLGSIASTVWLFFVMVATQGFQEVKSGGPLRLNNSLYRNIFPDSVSGLSMELHGSSEGFEKINRKSN